MIHDVGEERMERNQSRVGTARQGLRCTLACALLVCASLSTSCLVRYGGRPYPTNEDIPNSHVLRLHSDGRLVLNGSPVDLVALAQSAAGLSHEKQYIMIVQEDGVPLERLLSVGEVLAEARWRYFTVKPEELQKENQEVRQQPN